MLRDGGTYVEMGQFTDAGSIATSWHRICAKDLNVLGSWAFTGNDLPLGVDMLYRARDKYPWLEMQTLYPLHRGGRLAGRRRRDGDEDGEVDHRALAGAGGLITSPAGGRESSQDGTRPRQRRDDAAGPSRPGRGRAGPVRPPRALLCRVSGLLCRPARGPRRSSHAGWFLRRQRRGVLGRGGRARPGLRLHRRRLPERRSRGAAPALCAARTCAGAASASG